MSKQVSKKEKQSIVSEVPFWLMHKFSLFVFFTSFLLYFNSIPNDYNLDDEIVTRNHRLTSKGIGAIPEIFREPYYKDASGYAYEYRPVVLVTFAIENSIFGDNPHVSHFINVLLYSLLCTLLFVCLQMLLSDFGNLLPLLATLFFIVHPAHTEVIDGIKNRDEILALGGSLASLLFAVLWLDKNSWKYLFLSVVCFWIAMLSKQSAIVMAIIIPASLVFFRKPNFLRLLTLCALLLVPVFIYNPMPLVSSRIFLVVACLIAIISFFVYNTYFANIDRLKSLVQSVTKTSSKLLHTSKPKTNTEATTLFVSDNSTINIWTTLSCVVITLVCFLGALFCITYSHTYILIGIVCVYTLCAFLGNDSVKKLLFIPSFLLVLLSVYSFSLFASFYASIYLTAATVYFLFFKGQFRWVSIPVAVMCIAINITEEQYVMPIFDILPILLLTQRQFFPAIRIIVLVTVLTGFFIPLFNIFVGGDMYDDQVRFILIGLLFVITFRPKAVRIYSYLIPFTLIFQFLFLGAILNSKNPPYTISIQDVTVQNLTSHLPFMDKTATTIESSRAAIKDIGEVELTDNSTDRPVNFIEAPVNHASPLRIRVGTAFLSLSNYLHKIILPYPLSFYYGYRFIEPTDIFDTAPLISLCIYLALFVIAFLLIHKNRIVSFSIFWFLISISAFSNFFFPLPGSIADRFMFIPSIGWCLLLAYSIFKLFKIDTGLAAEKFRTLSKPAMGIIAFVLTLYSGLTFARNFQWKDHVTLMRHDVEYVKESAQAHNLLAVQLTIRSNSLPVGEEQFNLRQEAIPHFIKAIEIYPKFFNAVYDAARVYTMINQPDSALVYYRMAAAMNPSFYESHLSAGQILIQQGKLAEAVPFFDYVVKKFPTEGRSYDLLSYTYFQMKNFDSSIAVNRLGMNFIPNSPNPPTNIGRVYQMSLNKPDSALYYYKIAARLNPTDNQLQQMIQQLSISVK